MFVCGVKSQPTSLDETLQKVDIKKKNKNSGSVWISVLVTVSALLFKLWKTNAMLFWRNVINVKKKDKNKLRVNFVILAVCYQFKQLKDIHSLFIRTWTKSVRWFRRNVSFWISL